MPNDYNEWRGSKKIKEKMYPIIIDMKISISIEQYDGRREDKNDVNG